MNLPKQTHLVNRDGTYYFRRRIPLDLRSHYSPQKELFFSLNTKDYAEACRLSRAESVKSDNEFQRVKESLSTPPLETITEQDIKSLSDAWLTHILEEDEEVRIQGLTPREYRRIDEAHSIVDAGGRKALAMGDISLIEFEMVDFCESHGFMLIKESESYQRLAYSFLKTSVDANNKLMLRHQGEIVNTPDAPVVSHRVNQAVNSMDTFEGLRDYWITQATNALSRTAIAEANTMIKKFRYMIGDLKPSEVTKSHVVLIKDKMLEANSSPATINKGRGILAAIFSTAEQNLKLQNNPFKDMAKLALPNKDVDSPFNIDELQIIFNSPVFTQGYRPKRFKGESSYWIPLLGLYTGARLNELGQLYVEDVGDEDNIQHITIKPDSLTGRTIKDGKKRRVPIHPDLIKMGFLDYVKAMRELNHKQLFPELKVTRADGKLTDKWGSWWRGYIRDELNITRVPQPFHAFRHTFSDYCRRSKLAYEIQMRIEGHSMGNVGDRYGARLFPLQPLNEELQKLNFNGLDLSHLQME